MKKYKCNRCLKTAHNRENLKCFRCDRQIAEQHGMDTTGITFSVPSISFDVDTPPGKNQDATNGNDYSGGGGDFGGGGASSDF